MQSLGSPSKCPLPKGSRQGSGGGLSGEAQKKPAEECCCGTLCLVPGNGVDGRGRGLRQEGLGGAWGLSSLFPPLLAGGTSQPSLSSRGCGAGWLWLKCQVFPGGSGCSGWWSSKERFQVFPIRVGCLEVKKLCSQGWLNTVSLLICCTRLWGRQNEDWSSRGVDFILFLSS